jgi:transcription initiation factor TFIIE subunit alpha
MKESTIYESDDTMIKNEETGPSTTKQSPALPDDEIMALLVHEQPKKPPNNDTSSSSDTSDDEDDYTNRDTSSSAPKLTWQDESSMTSFGGGSVDTFDSDDSDDSEDELTLNVGGKLYQLSDIGPDVVDQMTPEEKDKYTQLCQKAYSDFY